MLIYKIQGKQFSDYNNFLETHIDNEKRNDLSLLNASGSDI